MEIHNKEPILVLWDIVKTLTTIPIYKEVMTEDENSIPKDGTTHAAIRDYYFSNDAKNILEFLNNNGYSFSIFNTEKVTGIQVDMNNQSKIITDPDKMNEIINEIYNSKDVRYYRDNPGYIIIKTFGDENWVAIGENQFSFME